MVLPIVESFLGGVSQAPTRRIPRPGCSPSCLVEKKGRFQISTDVEVNFLVLCGFLDRRTSGRDCVALSSLAEGNQSLRQRIIRLVQSGALRMETRQLISDNVYRILARKEKHVSQVADRTCLR